MADVTWRVRDENTRAEYDLKLVDQGDGTYALKTDSSSAATASVAVYDNKTRACVNLGLVSLGDGTYAVCVR